MKKIILTIATLAVTLGANAQVLKNNLLEGYKEGDSLEKSVIQAKDEVPTLDAWAGAFTAKPTEVPSPVIGKALSYPGYPEGGLSVVLGTPAGVKGNRFSVYPIDTKKAFYKGVFYLACVIEMEKIGASSAVDILGLSASATGASNRSAIKVTREGANNLKFATHLLKSQAETSMGYDYDKPHLVVLKLDYDNQTASLYVDPKSGEGEPSQADCVAHGDDVNVLKHPIRSITLRNRGGNDGKVGNIRFARTWDDLFTK